MGSGYDSPQSPPKATFLPNKWIPPNYRTGQPGHYYWERIGREPISHIDENQFTDEKYKAWAREENKHSAEFADRLNKHLDSPLDPSQHFDRARFRNERDIEGAGIVGWGVEAEKAEKAVEWAIHPAPPPKQENKEQANMIPNPFLQQIGPQAEGPPVMQPIDPQAAQYNAMLRARELQSRMAISDMVRGQQVGNITRGSEIGAQQLGKYLGTTISGSTAAALGGTAAPAAGTGSASASASANASASATAAGGGGSSLLGSLGQGLGVAAVGYGTYKSNQAATQSIHDLKDAIAGGNLTPDEERAARQKVFNAGMVSEGIGGIGGALGGSSYGPVGTVLGAALGASGGARQAWQAADTNPERVKAMEQFVRNPFAR